MIMGAWQRAGRWVSRRRCSDPGIDAEAADLLDTGRRRHPTPDLQDRARITLTEVESRIEDIIRIRDGLRQVIDARCASLTRCTCPEGSLLFEAPAGPAAKS